MSDNDNKKEPLNSQLMRPPKIIPRRATNEELQRWTSTIDDDMPSEGTTPEGWRPLDMPSAPLSRDEAFARFCAVVARVPDLDLRDALRHAAIDYAGAATSEAITSCFDSFKSCFNAR